MKMHHDEVHIDAELVGRLVAAQFPELAGLAISAVRSTGTVNAIYRIGDHLCARLPRIQRWAEDLDNEWRWLPKLAPRLSLQVPEPVGRGNPASSYPFSWAIYGWIDGQPYADELVHNEREAARDLGQFVVELHRIDPVAEAPRAGRKPLRELDAVTRTAIESGRGVIDSHAATAAWARALDVDDGTWNRARGFALHQAALIIPYYAETNPGFVSLAKRIVEEVLADVNA